MSQCAKGCLGFKKSISIHSKKLFALCGALQTQIYTIHLKKKPNYAIFILKPLSMSSLCLFPPFPPLRDGIFNHFIGRVRNNLHVVLCMSPVGDAFRSRCRMFPSLVNCCTIDWFTEWPRYAVIDVSSFAKIFPLLIFLFRRVCL